MTTFRTLEDVLSAYAEAAQYESIALFAQGDALALACEPETRARLGYDTQEALLRDVGAATGSGRRTLIYRLKVARVFPPDARNTSLAWGVHREAARVVRDVEDADQLAEARAWLAAAADEAWTADVLANTIKAAQGAAARAERAYICRARECLIAQVVGNRLTLVFEGALDVQPGRAWVTLSAETDETVQDDAPGEMAA